jgi:ABC-type phosphate/phosphonate transport system substrate-binding protein
MYNAAWNNLFGSVFLELGLDVEIIDHPWPRPIESLWTRPDLLCGFMCGWPFINSPVPIKPLAVPVLAPSRYQGNSRYCSEFLARRDSGWTTLSESFGHRFGYMTENSQSGFHAPRSALAPFARQRGGTLFSAVIGPLDTPARSLAALRDSEVDLIALDSFYLDLLRAHRPEALDGVMMLASTAWTAMPLLVAANAAADEIVACLATKLTSLHEEPQYVDMLSAVLVRRFEAPDIDSYSALNQLATSATQLGYQTMR